MELRFAALEELDPPPPPPSPSSPRVQRVISKCYLSLPSQVVDVRCVPCASPAARIAHGRGGGGEGEEQKDFCEDESEEKEYWKRR